MNNGNWFAVSRTIFDHHLVGIKDRPFTEMEAWLWLIAEAEFESRPVINKGQRIVLDPGQMMAAHGYLAERWRWTVDKVRWFLKRLQNEAMIARYCNDQANTNPNTNPHTTQNTSPPTSSRTNQIQIITICNYSDYQFTERTQHQALHHPSSQPKHRPEHQASHQQYKDNTLTPKHKTPPLPPKGGEPLAVVKRKRRTDATDDQALAAAALDLWNQTAERLRLAECRSFTDARRRRLLARLKDIGGIERFRVALCQIHRVPFLMGKIPPKPGQQAFKLDIDRLLQTDGNLGDVLAKLIDKAAEPEVGPNGKAWGWWKANEVQLRALSPEQWRKTLAAAKPNGVWPWWLLTGYPGTPDCCIHPDVVRDENLVLRYGEQANG